MTAPNDPTNKMGGGSDARMGLAFLADSDAVAGGNGGPTTSACKYCGETDGHHTGQCVVVSHHARLGIYARWACKGCTSTQFAGRYPCSDCCGFTTDGEKVVRGVMTLKNRPNVRCPQ